MQASRSKCLCSPGLIQPDIPGQRTDLFIIEGTAAHLQSNLDLTVVIALMPDHVLEVKQGMIVVNAIRLESPSLSHSRGGN
jgi:hypothetical protein